MKLFPTETSAWFPDEAAAPESDEPPSVPEVPLPVVASSVPVVPLSDEPPFEDAPLSEEAEDP